jgi:DNA uptake protein ComE-like DNA-binding protein
MFQKIKSFLFHFFHFNKQERNGVFVLFVILVVVFLFKWMMPYVVVNNSSFVTTDVELDKQSNALDTSLKNETASSQLNTSKVFERDLFVFNPNVISAEEAMQLGFSKKLTATLLNFRKKGGRFFKPDDLKKLYGLPPTLFQTLESYILIPNHQREFKKDSVYERTYPKKSFAKTILEINSADSLSIVYLKGIGPSFTKRIIKYRTMLGGFHNMKQLKEIYGMTDSLYVSLSNQIQIDKTKLVLIPINTIDLNPLRKHPYFNFQSAQAIINFRLKHGKLTEKDIIDLGIFNSEKLSVILPYLTY